MAPRQRKTQQIVAIVIVTAMVLALVASAISLAFS